MKQTERSELTRKKILAAALSEFGSRGYAGVMINEICALLSKTVEYHVHLSKWAWVNAVTDSDYTF